MERKQIYAPWKEEAVSRSRRIRMRTARTCFVFLLAVFVAGGGVWLLLTASGKGAGGEGSGQGGDSARDSGELRTQGGNDSGQSGMTVHDGGDDADSRGDEREAGSFDEGDGAWQLMLVNAWNPVPEGYKPPLQSVGYDCSFDARAAGALLNMLGDARAEGLSPILCSGYRTLEKQRELYDAQVVKQQNKGLSYEQACEAARTVVAYPGTSEHNLGLAVDIVALDYQQLDEDQSNTPEAQWLMANCCRYGFILRYPSGKSDLTGVIFEPWHYRYVGVEAATRIMEEGLCLEEYLDDLRSP